MGLSVRLLREGASGGWWAGSGRRAGAYAVCGPDFRVTCRATSARYACERRTRFALCGRSSTARRTCPTRWRHCVASTRCRSAYLREGVQSMPPQEITRRRSPTTSPTELRAFDPWVRRCAGCAQRRTADPLVAAFHDRAHVACGFAPVDADASAGLRARVTPAVIDARWADYNQRLALLHGRRRAVHDFALAPRYAKGAWAPIAPESCRLRGRRRATRSSEHA